EIKEELEDGESEEIKEEIASFKQPKSNEQIESDAAFFLATTMPLPLSRNSSQGEDASFPESIDKDTVLNHGLTSQLD
ncbi:4045_t:CDS:2, partial [Entrophospora sp. SA101]